MTFEIPTKIIFGEGSFSKISEIISKDENFLLICGAHFLETKEFSFLKKNFPQMEILSGVKPEPKLNEIEIYWNKVKGKKPRSILAIGGGSVIDTAKVLAAKFTNKKENFRDFFGKEKIKKKCLKLIAIPTTSGSGSEVTKYSVIKDSGIKKVIISEKIYPEIAIVDPMLTLSTSKELTAYAGLDALSHNLESYMSKKANLFSEIYSIEGVRLCLKWLEKAYENGNNIEARRGMSLASLFGGIAITNAPTGIVHLLSKILDSFVEIPHGLGNAIFLPYAIKYCNSEKLQKLERELKIENLPEHLVKLNENLRIPRLGEFKISQEDFIRKTKENITLVVDPSSTAIGDENLINIILESM
ncbi:MAG: iron-containing alcohol dehydrogenase [Candidatus Altiarchaeota archaeon]